MIKNLCYIITTIFIFQACQPQEQSYPAPPSWQLVYKNAPNGEALSGDKGQLMDAIRQGYPIRVGWASRRVSDSVRSVEHVVDAEFREVA